VQLEYATALAGLERGRIMAEAKERHVDDVAHDVELAGAARVARHMFVVTAVVHTVPLVACGVMTRITVHLWDTS
jgi:hypothetical protein